MVENSNDVGHVDLERHIAEKYDIERISKKAKEERSTLDARLLEIARTSLPDQNELNWPIEGTYEVKKEDVTGGMLAILAREFPESELNETYYSQLAYAQLFRSVGPTVNVIEPGDQLRVASGAVQYLRHAGSTLEPKSFDVPLYPWNIASAPTPAKAQVPSEHREDPMRNPKVIELMDARLADREEEYEKDFPEAVVQNVLVPLLKQYYPAAQYSYWVDAKNVCHFRAGKTEVAAVQYEDGMYSPVLKGRPFFKNTGGAKEAFEHSSLEFYSTDFFNKIAKYPFPVDKGANNGDPFYLNEDGDIMRNMFFAADTPLGYHPPVIPYSYTRGQVNAAAVSLYNQVWRERGL